MALVYLSDILKRAGLDLKRTKLIRHAKSDKEFNECYMNGLYMEYTCRQKTGFSDNYDHWVVFVSDKSTRAVLEGCYKVNGEKPDSADLIPDNFPNRQSWLERDGSVFELEHIDVLKELEGRLIIDWGKGTRMWHQKATTEKEIVAIKDKQKVEFKGYENVCINYEELKSIVEDNITYEDWHTALSLVYGVYLITDLTDGRQYVGSAYGKEGILQRWTVYVNSYHGDNKKLKSLLKEYPERYKSFQFSILQICSKSMTDDEIINLENLYKRKLRTREFGLNDN